MSKNKWKYKNYFFEKLGIRNVGRQQFFHVNSLLLDPDPHPQCRIQDIQNSGYIRFSYNSKHWLVKAKAK